MKPCGLVNSGRQRGPEPGGGFGSASAEVSNLIPAICTNAWPGFVYTVIHCPSPLTPHFMKSLESNGVFSRPAACST